MKNYITLPDGRRKTCRIFDAGDKVNDRHTAVYRAVRSRNRLFWPYLGMNEMPFSPNQGVCQHGELNEKPGRYLGKRIAFEQLPIDCQKVIIQDLT